MNIEGSMYTILKIAVTIWSSLGCIFYAAMFLFARKCTTIFITRDYQKMKNHLDTSMVPSVSNLEKYRYSFAAYIHVSVILPYAFAYFILYYNLHLWCCVIAHVIILHASRCLLLMFSSSCLIKTE